MRKLIIATVCGILLAVTVGFLFYGEFQSMYNANPHVAPVLGTIEGLTFAVGFAGALIALRERKS